MSTGAGMFRCVGSRRATFSHSESVSLCRFGVAMVVQFSDAVEKAIEQAIERMRAHARAIGELCMSWAALEHAVDRLLEPLLDCDRGTAAAIASATDRLAARIDIIRRLLVHQELNGPWRDWIEKVLNRITNEVAPARNRCVHDRWRIQRGLIMKIDKRASIARPQSHHPQQLIFDTVPAKKLHCLIL